ncbi:reverse transcriptase-like protein, partial [Patescibacteria group bacterium]|nr:reverse transcriptase-like protein [Patescibacteria group bacterium]
MSDVPNLTHFNFWTPDVKALIFMKYILYTDGGSRGNPGEAALGVVICNEKGDALKKYNQALGEMTNNEAEYQALIFGLKKLKQVFGKEAMKQS